MNVVLISDSKYAVQCAVTLQSLFDSGNVCKRVFLITTGMQDDTIHRLRLMCSKQGCGFTVYIMDEHLLDPFSELSGWSKYTFMKVFIPLFLPAEIEKCIYLDVDLMVVGQLNDIYNQSNDSRYAVYGVADYPYTGGVNADVA